MSKIFWCSWNVIYWYLGKCKCKMYLGLYTAGWAGLHICISEKRLSSSSFQLVEINSVKMLTTSILLTLTYTFREQILQPLQKFTSVLSESPRVPHICSWIIPLWISLQACLIDSNRMSLQCLGCFLPGENTLPLCIVHSPDASEAAHF